MRRSLLSLALLALAGCGEGAMTGADAGSGAICNGSTCSAGQICVAVTTSGGACMPKNGASCPAGNFETTCPGGAPGCVARSTAYACKPKPADCTGAVDCACATPTLCPGAGCSCSRASETDYGCVCQAP